MEFLLNFAWVALAVAMVVIWARLHPRAGVPKLTQLAALAVSLLILLPVISISDDLMAAQFPAETDSSLRWGQRAPSSHPVPHHVPVLPPSQFAGLAFPPQAWLIVAASHFAFILPQISILRLNRPPPAL